MRFWSFGAVAACCLMLPIVALAQTGADFAVRRDLLEQAQAAASAGDHTRALERASRAATIQMTPSVRMFIAQEELALGRFAEALNDSELCVREATEAPGTMPNRESIIANCTTFQRDSHSRVGHVVVRAPTPAIDGLHVRVAGHDLPDALIGVPYIVTPGTVVVEATASGYENAHTEVSVGTGASVEVPLQLTRSAGTTAASTHGSGQAAHAQGGGGISIPAVVVLGVGVLGVVAGGLMGGLQLGDVSQLDSMCGSSGTQCPQSAMGLLGQASALTLGANIAFVVGGVVTAVGAAWLVVSMLGSHGSHEHAANRGAWVPFASAQGVGIVGTF